MRATVFSIIVISSLSLSATETATQTDWSGGGGVPGPVTDWGNTYDSAGQINNAEGAIRLSSAVIELPVKHLTENTFEAPVCVISADIDDDGDTDIISSSISHDAIVWYENTDGFGTSWAEHRIIWGSFWWPISVFVSDVDSDGDMDVLGTAMQKDIIAWWENTDGTGTLWDEHIISGVFYGAFSVRTADMDGDGDMDVLGAADYLGAIEWFENTNGVGGTWTEHLLETGLTDARLAVASDINGDGYMDVAAVAREYSHIIWWENTDGSALNWIRREIDGDYDTVIYVYATDIDGDDDIDILGASEKGNDITWWENTDGAGTVWTEHPVAEDSFDRAISVHAADLDGDGDTDVLGAAYEGDDVTWWENTDGTGTSWTEHIVEGDYDGAYSVYAADVNGDGDADIIAAAALGDEISWWDVISYPVTGTLESSVLNAGAVNSWEAFVSGEEEPPGTSVSYQFRSSADPSNMGAWSDTVFASGALLSNILADSTNYLQYRVILQTTDSTSSPTLDNVAFSYTNSVRVDEPDGTEVAGWGLASEANPSFGSCKLQVSLPQQAVVDLLLYDVTGRVAARYSQELPGGTHSVVFSSIAQGVYFCTMHAEDFNTTERIVVLK